MKVGKKHEADYVNEKIETYNKSSSEKGDIWYKAWIDDRSTRFEPKFIELFNKHMSEKNATEIGEGDNYLMTVNTYFTEPGFNVGISRKSASVSLTFTFTHKSTGKELAMLEVDNVSANNFLGADFDTGFRIQESYSKAGRQFAKFLIKELKLK